jgi:hypothetical protein
LHVSKRPRPTPRKSWTQPPSPPRIPIRTPARSRPRTTRGGNPGLAGGVGMREGPYATEVGRPEVKSGAPAPWARAHGGASASR